MSAIGQLVVASKNQDKIIEIEAVLVAEGLVDEIVKGLAWHDVEETEETLEGNALLKARAVMETTRLPSLADDTGLEVTALGGAPGVHTARFAGPGATYQDNVDKMLAVLDGVADRAATFRTVIALLWPDGRQLIAEGRLDGQIALKPRGESGFGYDPIFEIDGITLSEMGTEQKNLVSHRSRALRSLAALLR